MVRCNRDCEKCKSLEIRADEKGIPYAYNCIKYGDSVFREDFKSTKEFKELKDFKEKT